MKKFFTKAFIVCCLLFTFSFTTTELSAQCAASNVPACVNQFGASYNTVITNDTFCCNTSWDSICQNAYDALSGTCTGNCAATPASCVQVGSSAYLTVIANDPFCCDNTWDTICQNAYDALNSSCTGCITPPACVNTNGSAYATVIANDAFCCNTSWDSICQNAFDALSGTCTGICSAVAPTCVNTNGSAYSTVITNDPFCCDVTWDSICQNAYDAISGTCTGICSAVAPSCVNTNGSAYSTVIANDPFCCDNTWDSICQNAYNALSGTCTGNCAATPASCVQVGSSAYLSVIANDPFCCDNTWDTICQNAYDALNSSCTACITPPACVNTNGSAYATVIANDTFCCSTGWDSICQNAYNALSGTCTGNCAIAPPACVQVGSSAYLTVIANDPFCCDTGWDSLCQNAYNALNASCLIDCPALGLNIGDPCLSGPFNGTVSANCQCVVVCAATPACVITTSSAYNQVINNDPFCCNTQWDSICQTAYDALSSSCGACNVDGGTVSTNDQRTGLCKGDGQSDFIQFTVTGNVGVGAFGIVRQSDLQIVATNTTGLFNIENLPAGSYLAGYVSVQNSGQLAGITNVNQLSGCFDLSNQLAVTSIQLAGGVVTTSGVTTVCGGNVVATVSGNQGPQSRFALLNQTATVVIAQNTTGVFNFTPLATGIYRIVHISFSNVNLGTIIPPVLPRCVAASNLVTVTKVACPSAMLESSPNPTSGTSYVTFSVPTEEYTTLEVYDMSGRKVTELFRQVTEADAEYRLEFDGLGLPNGVYIYRLTTGTDVIIEKFMIAK